MRRKALVGVVKMADREYNVYQAKLAEQAERYDGELIASKFYPGIVESGTYI